MFNVVQFFNARDRNDAQRVKSVCRPLQSTRMLRAFFFTGIIDLFQEASRSPEKICGRPFRDFSGQPPRLR
jgi:hypothetical protein